MDVLPTPADEVAEPAWDSRLAGVEGRLDILAERLGRLESTVRVAVGEEMQGASADLRRAISELGRRLVQDLPSELRRHRDAIVAEVVAQVVAELRTAAPSSPPAGPGPADPTADPGPDPSEQDEAQAVDAAGDVAAERRRASRLRRRHG